MTSIRSLTLMEMRTVSKDYAHGRLVAKILLDTSSWCWYRYHKGWFEYLEKVRWFYPEESESNPDFKRPGTTVTGITFKVYNYTKIYGYSVRCVKLETEE